MTKGFTVKYQENEALRVMEFHSRELRRPMEYVVETTNDAAPRVAPQEEVDEPRACDLVFAELKARYGTERSGLTGNEASEVIYRGAPHTKRPKRSRSGPGSSRLSDLQFRKIVTQVSGRRNGLRIYDLTEYGRSLDKLPRHWTTRD